MIKNFDTLTDFFNDQNKGIVTGDLIKTYGYKNVLDGGDALYKVVSVSATNSEDVDFNGLKVTCKGYKLELIPESNTVRVEQFGAIGVNQNENLTDEQIAVYASTNKVAIQNALFSGVSQIEFKRSMCYYTEENILVPPSMDVCGNGATLILKPTSTNKSTQLFCLDYEPEDNMFTKASSIKDLRIVGACGSSGLKPISSIRINCAFGVTISNVCFDGGDYAVYAKKRVLEGYDIIGINIVDCKAENMNNGFAFYTATDVKIKNCQLKLKSSNSIPYGTGLVINDNSGGFLVEDCSIIDSSWFAVVCSDNVWDTCADSRIVFKNLLVDKANFAVGITSNDVPVHFLNAMFVDVDYGFYLEYAKNLKVSNSSVLIKSPSTAAADAVPISAIECSEAKFIHTQFEFPWDFQRIDIYDSGDPSEFSFVDCTLQKFDISGVYGVTSPSGFGTIGNISACAGTVVQFFDACEFRSCIQNHIIRDENENIIGYNFPAEIQSASGNGSKLIIKNSRFVNETACDVPCFRLYDGYSPDNIVVYNCFFENYNCSYEVEVENEAGTEIKNVYPIFGKLTNNTLSSDVSAHNIFAKCNIRSSAPDRENGTTINEMKTYE